jgi:hypothetical protein
MRAWLVLLSVSLAPMALAQSVGTWPTAQAPVWPEAKPTDAPPSSGEFAPPPGPYGYTFNPYPATFAPNWGWNAPTAGVVAPPLPGSFANVPPAQTYVAPAQAMPNWPGYDATPPNLARPPQGAARPDSGAFNPGAQQQVQWPTQGYAYDGAGSTAPPSVGPTYPSVNTPQWRVAQPVSRQSVIYPGITPVEAYAPQQANPQGSPTGYTPPPGYQPPAYPQARDQREWSSPSQGDYPYPEQFPRR